MEENPFIQNAANWTGQNSENAPTRANNNDETVYRLPRNRNRDSLQGYVSVALLKIQKPVNSVAAECENYKYRIGIFGSGIYASAATRR